MANADLTHAEWLGLLIDRGEPEKKTIQWIVFPANASRETKRFESRMRTARLRHVGAAVAPKGRPF